MNRRTFIALSCATVAGLWGCGSSQLPLRTLTRTELEADMAQRLGLHDVTLTDQGGGRFTGTGKDAQGRLVELEVKQELRRRSWKNSWKDPNGSSTSGEGSISW
jgi:hypothetical protein